jgi:hypothetical protein
VTSIGMRAASFAVVAAAVSAMAAGASAATPKCVHGWNPSPSSLAQAEAHNSYTCKAPADLSSRAAKDTHAVCSGGFILQGSPVPVPPPLGGVNMVGPPVYRHDGRYIYVCITPSRPPP